MMLCCKRRASVAGSIVNATKGTAFSNKLLKDFTWLSITQYVHTKMHFEESSAIVAHKMSAYWSIPQNKSFYTNLVSKNYIPNFFFQPAFLLMISKIISSHFIIH